jgi:hypothetical protein
MHAAHGVASSNVHARAQHAGALHTCDTLRCCGDPAQCTTLHWPLGSGRHAVSRTSTSQSRCHDQAACCCSGKAQPSTPPAHHRLHAPAPRIRTHTHPLQPAGSPLLATCASPALSQMMRPTAAAAAAAAAGQSLKAAAVDPELAACYDQMMCDDYSPIHPARQHMHMQPPQQGYMQQQPSRAFMQHQQQQQQQGGMVQQGQQGQQPQGSGLLRLEQQMAQGRQAGQVPGAAQLASTAYDMQPYRMQGQQQQGQQQEQQMSQHLMQQQQQVRQHQMQPPSQPPQQPQPPQQQQGHGGGRVASFAQILSLGPRLANRELEVRCLPLLTTCCCCAYAFCPLASHIARSLLRGSTCTACTRC